MKNAILIACLAALALTGCEDRRKKAIEQIGSDEAIVKKASAAVNEVIRNSTDCEAAKPLLTEAYAAIETAQREATLPASQQTLLALKAQADRVAQVCP
jgi:predicted aminopeptidase